MKRTLVSILLVLIFLTSLSACNLPSAATTAPPTNTPPAIPSDTPVPPTPEPPTETPTPTEIPPRYRGFWAQEGSVFRAYDFTGAPLGMEINVSGARDYLGIGNYQVVGNTAYYYNDSAQQVYRSSVGGAPAPVAFLPTDFSIKFAVSLDGSQIAWSTDDWDQAAAAPFSTMWMANIDGSNMREIASIPAAGNQESFLVVAPLRWTENGRLLYTTNITGIGGYILFWGFNELLSYNPADGISTIFTNDQYGICLNDISPDYSHVAAGCGPTHSDGVQIIEVGSWITITMPMLPDQGQSGSATFSPDGQKIAYAVARTAYDNEYGQVAVAPIDGSAVPVVVAAFGPGYFHVVGWIDDEVLLIERYEFSETASSTTLWSVNIDGSGLTQIANGYFRGFVPNP